MAALSSPDEDDGSTTRHRADALEPHQAGDMAVDSRRLAATARPLPTPPIGHHSGPSVSTTTTPSGLPPPPHPSPSITHPGLTASSSGRRDAPRRSHECTHPILVRMYSRHHTCECCSRLPPEGYVFRCAQDRELILADLIRHKEHFPFDQLGRQLAGLVKPIRRGAELRAAGATRDSVLEEMTAAEAASYSEAQTEELAAQRKHALRTAKEDTFRALFPRSAAVLRARIEAVVDAALGEAPWVPQEEDECHLMVCRQCRPYYSERCFLSLGGIANGDVPPTAALGFGFHVHDRRPIVDATIVRRLGLRDVSKAHTTHRRQDIDHCRGLSAPPPFDLMELIQAHLGGADDLQQPMSKSMSQTPPLDGSGKTQPQSIVKASDSDTENTPASSSCTRLARCAAAGSPNRTPHYLSDNNDELACVPTQLRHSGRLLPPKRESFDLACRTPLPRPDQKELVVLAVDPQDLPAAAAAADSAVVGPIGPSPWLGHEFMPKTAMEQQEDVDGVFGAGPLSVPGGLAVTEEGVEMGIADVATTNVG